MKIINAIVIILSLISFLSLGSCVYGQQTIQKGQLPEKNTEISTSTGAVAINEQNIKGGFSNKDFVALPQPVDANGDGVINPKDLNILMQKSVNLFDTKLLPILKKAGYEMGGEIPSNIKDIMRDKLTITEQNEFKRKMTEFRNLDAQIASTTKKIMPALFKNCNTVDEIRKRRKALDKLFKKPN